MTTDALNGATRAVRHAGAALAGWLALLAAFTVVFEPSGAVTLLGPERQLASAVARTEARIVTAGAGYMTIAGGSHGVVRDLYRGGAWLVLPALGQGCSGKSGR